MTTSQFPIPDPYGPHQPTGQWVQPPGTWGPAPYGPVGPPAQAVNPAGIVVALVGGALAMIGAFLDWYTKIKLGDIVNALDVDGAKAFPKAYFGWGMWVVLGATGVCALFANVPSGAAAALRVLSPVLGVLGAVLVFAALNSLISNGSPFDNSDIGLYLVLFGFVITGFGGVFGPRRVHPPQPPGY